ncbi:hypothetical protein [Actinomycetospora chiangmaiensis]|uniref:hypothetical protein n=1 Tax=Actinomycetospora chiangmaiensis TaxID=402650 RepID=UPI00037E7EEE|nr:hypothetical protein [Actinomycetospora chiangmaiensis]
MSVPRWADAPVDLLIGIDDTDNPTSRGTGWLAQQLLAELAARGFGSCAGATRHQLLKHPRIPYTSHNSSACLAWCAAPDVGPERLADVVGAFLEERSAPGSDPGLAVAAPGRLSADDRTYLGELGRRAKAEVLPVPLAHDVARDVGVHLSGHGGTEDGVLGALAAVGLHLSGADGFFLWMPGTRELPTSATYAELRDRVPIDAACDPHGAEPAPGDVLELGDWVRPVLLAGRAVLLLRPQADDGSWVVQPRYVVREH